MGVSTDFGDQTALGRRTPASELSRSAVVVRFLIGLAGFATLAVLVILHPPVLNQLFLSCVIGMVLAEALLKVRVTPGGYFAISFVFVLVYFSIVGALGAALLDAVARTVIWLIDNARKGKRKQTTLFAFFSIGQSVLAILAGGLLVEMILGRPALFRWISFRPTLAIEIFALGIFLAFAFLSSAATYARAGWLEVRTALWPTTILWLGVSLAANIPFAILVMLVARTTGFLVASMLILSFLVAIALILKLNVSLRAGSDELKVVNRIAGALNATLDLNEIFRILARESKNVLGWDGFFVAIGERSAPEIKIIFMTEGGSEISSRSLRNGTGLTGRAIQSGELIYYEKGEKGNDENDEDSLRGGKRRPHSIVVAPMKFNGQPIGAISLQSIRSDVYGPSQFRLLQTIAGQAASAIRNAQLFQSEQKAKSERDEFFALVTHEIKNPLTSIKGYTELAEGSLEADDREGIRESLGVIRSEAGRILRLTEDLLDASRLAAGKFSMKTEQFDLRAVVSQVAARYAATSSHTIKTSFDEGMGEFKGDSVRLGQVVENLLSNAVKYSPPGTQISVSVQLLNGKVTMAVRDQGMGISPEKLPLIFERFYRVEEGGQSVKGTGVGLFVTRQIVEMHGGTVSVESSLGKGSVFTVTLPAA